jgi:prolipoprotein diacylglyceryltransferase
MIRFTVLCLYCFWFGLVYNENIFEEEGESIEKLDSLFIWSVLATLIGARLGHVLFLRLGYFNNLLKYFLPVRFSPSLNSQVIRDSWSHGAAISICCYVFSKKNIERPLFGFWIA